VNEPPNDDRNSENDKRLDSGDARLIEEVDYVIDADTGLFIFTTKYLLKRGTCCKSGCRHCPYGFKIKGV
jgi:hypothetical protein